MVETGGKSKLALSGWLILGANAFAETSAR
jgi:hypothetical protein